MNYDNEFRQQAVALSDEIGPKKAAEQLGIPYYTLTTWRSRRSKYGENAYVGSGHSREPLDPKEQRIRELEKQNKELQRANDILKDALGFFAESRKK
jgi:transposase